MSQQLSTLDLLAQLEETLNNPLFLSVPAPSCPIDPTPKSTPKTPDFTPDYNLDNNLDHILFTEEEWQAYELDAQLSTEEEEDLEEAYQFYLNDRLSRYGY